MTAQIIRLKRRGGDVPARPARPPHALVDATRGDMLTAFRAWLATDPPEDVVAQEIETTANAMRQQAELARGTGT